LFIPLDHEQTQQKANIFEANGGVKLIDYKIIKSFTVCGHELRKSRILEKY